MIGINREEKKDHTASGPLGRIDFQSIESRVSLIDEKSALLYCHIFLMVYRGEIRHGEVKIVL